MSETSLRCIFCQNALTERTKPEHVLLNALGGRKATSRAICSECNNLFGRSIDRALAAQVEVIRNLLQMQSGTRKPPPTLKGVRSSSETLSIGGDGTLKLEGKPFKVDVQPDGTCTVQITARSMEHANELLPNIAAAIGISEKALRAQMGNAQARLVEQRPGTIPFSLSFGGSNAIRSATKACLVLWSTVTGTDEIRTGEYAAARRFVVHGDEEFLTTRTKLDSRLLPGVDEIRSRYGPLFNSIVVRSDASGRVVGHFTLYNMIGFQVRLAEGANARDLAVGLVSNPLEPTSWSDRFVDEFDIPFEWLGDPAYDPTMVESKARVDTLMRTYFEVFQPRAVGHIIDDAFERRGFSEDDPVPAESLNEVISEVTHRLALHHLGRPYEQPLTPEEVRKVFGVPSNPAGDTET